MPGKIYRALSYRFLGSVDRIIATSPDYLASSLLLQDFSSKTTVIPIGLDEIASVPTQLVEHRRSLVAERFFFFSALFGIMRAFSFWLRPLSGLALAVVVGGSGDMEAALQAANLSNVQLVGQLSQGDKEALISLARAFVFPSHLRSEVFGVAARGGTSSTRDDIL